MKTSIKALNKRKKLRQLSNPRWLYHMRRSLLPISPKFGMDRGTPIDRWYIEQFYQANNDVVRGDVLEIRDNLHVTENEKISIFNDSLESLKSYGDASRDCLIVTQSFQHYENLMAAVNACYRVLRSGGTLLATFPALSRMDPHYQEYWRFTNDGVKSLCKSFADVQVATLGNILTGVGFWIGQAAEEFSKKELEYHDKTFPVIITLKAKK